MAFSFRNLIFKKTVVPNKDEYFKNKVDSFTIPGKGSYYGRNEISSSIYTAIAIISNTISKLPINVYKANGKGREIFKEHKWHKAIRYSPDKVISTSKWINYAVTQMYLSGNAFFLKSEFDASMDSNNKKLIALCDLEKILPHEGQVWYKFKELSLWVPSTDLIHFYDFSKNTHVGEPILNSLKAELGIQQGAEGALKSFYENGLLSNIYIESNLEGVGNADKNKAKEYFEQLQTEFQGWHNSGKIAKIPPMYSIKALPTSQIDYLANSKYTIAQIAAAFRIPGFYLGVNEGGGTYGKVEEQQLAFKNICLSNICNIIRSELEHKILTVDERNEGITIDFDYANLYDIDLVSKANFFKTLSQIGAISPNQVAESFGLPHIEGGNGSLHFLQRQYYPLEWMDKAVPLDNNPVQELQDKSDSEPDSKQPE